MELTIDQALQQGIAAHKEGRLQDAERLYRTILQTDPVHPDANHNLGVLAVSLDKSGAALPFFKTALEANPGIEQFWLSYINALIKEKQFDNAEEVIGRGRSQGVASDKLDNLEAQVGVVNQTEYSNNLGPSQMQVNNLLEFYQSARYGDAEKSAVSLTKEFPNHQFGWKVLGAVLKQMGRTGDSLAPNQKSVELAPQDSEALANLGATFKDLGRLEEAEASYRQAVALDPNFHQAHNNLGMTLKDLGKLEQARQSYQEAVAQKPDFSEAHYNLGNALRDLGRLEEAEASYRQAVGLKTDFAQAYNNLGITLKKLGRMEEAEESYKRAVSLKSVFPEAYNNLGNIQNELGKFEQAEESLRQAIALKPDFADAKLNLSLVLAVSNFLEGNFTKSKKHVLAGAKIQSKLNSQFESEKIYQSYLSKLLDWHENNYFDNSSFENGETLYVIGESHSLTSHLLCIKRSQINYICKSFLVKGCKQWHLGSPKPNHYKKKFEDIFQNIPKFSEVMLAIGEIDCRLDSGIIKHHKKCQEAMIEESIVNTVKNYFSYILDKNRNFNHRITIQGVPCPNVDTVKYKKTEIRQLIDVIGLFNEALEMQSKKNGFMFLDLHKLTDRGDGFSNGIWHVDDYHVSPEALLEAWRCFYRDEK